MSNNVMSKILFPEIKNICLITKQYAVSGKKIKD
jgi:hypothetical protein